MTLEEKENYFASRIKDYLENNPIQFLMYAGGSGGEFMSIILSKYSPLFTPINYAVTININRYHVDIPNILSSIIFNRPKSDELDVFYKNAAKIVLSRGMNNIDHELEILDKFVKGKRPLVRTHSSNSKFFNKDNTYFMLPDNQEVHKYATALRFCKVYNNEITLEKSRLLYNIYKTSIVDIKEDGFDMNAHTEAALNWLESKGKEFVLEVFNDALARPAIARKVNYEFDQFFSLKPNELLEQYNVEMTGTYSKLFTWQQERLNILKMSEFFKSGYLEELFQINDPMFRKELTAWHVRNLELIDEFGLDTRDFQFHI